MNESNQTLNPNAETAAADVQGNPENETPAFEDARAIAYVNHFDSQAYTDMIAPLRTWAEIRLDQIGHNMEEVRRLCGKTDIIGILKADAYGHGAVACGKALQRADVEFFAVACIDEAIELREASISDPILILGYTPNARFDELIEYDLIQSALSKDFAHALSDYGQAHGTKMRVHVKADTGMNRTGLLYEANARHFNDFVEVFELPGLQIEGIFSHFPVSDDLAFDSREFTRSQMKLFDELIFRLQEKGYDTGARHIQNSYGILNYMDAGYDYCRPGLLYMGITSDDEVPIASQPDFVPILSLKTKVSMVKTIPDQATVSYGRHYTAHGPRQIASLAIGYADGLSRACSNKGLMVSIRGHLVPIVGNICMDQCMVDITGFDDIEAGDTAVLIGQDGDNVLKVDEISRKAGTINNETLSILTRRVKRIYFDEDGNLA